MWVSESWELCTETFVELLCGDFAVADVDDFSDVSFDAEIRQG